ncbi:MAG: ribbon-helix-helix domain-containing protein [Actinomycetota bacterium]|nr:ribbon-helix-helix domain-containing protein [Actinomycetota bacterium]
MKRTNIYLDESQSAALEQVARTQGISRAEVIRQLIDRSIGESGADLDADLAAIRDSFGITRAEDIAFGRGSDERSRHLNRMAEL